MQNRDISLTEYKKVHLFEKSLAKLYRPENKKTSVFSWHQFICNQEEDKIFASYPKAMKILQCGIHSIFFSCYQITKFLYE